MGNTNAKESRPGGSSYRHRSSLAPALDPSASSQHDHSRSRNRVSRGDLGGLLGIGTTGGSSSNAEPSYERRETKQEREARRLEKERILRIKERERSIREEHVDGGYLVTMGVYVGAEDFNKQVVRQLQVDRKVAPFWRGLNDFSETWAEHQIVAAARGLPIPPADQTPPEELTPRPLSSSASPSTSNHNLASLTVPMGGRTLSTASDRSSSNVGSALPSPTASAAPSKGLTSSPFKPRAKALAAALSVSSRNGSNTEIAPREINLPHDPFVNGQPLEVFLYKEGAECPICFLYYPPYLNHTRCCDQAICSECFVQIKRPDPHFPEGHGDQENPTATPEETVGLLISEPAQCPYCQQPDFGVTYEPPPFRRGLTHAFSTTTVGSMNAAMSSSSSINSNLSPTSPLSGGGPSRRRTQSLSVNAPNVITTDRVRPDWAAKLSAQRNHQARRAAAATALHTAAFLMGDSGSRPFSRISRFSRRNTGGASAASNNNAGDSSPSGGQIGHSGSATPAGPEPGPRNSSGRALLAGPTSDRRSHMENLENMMLAEAIRLSLAAEEERKRKVDKEERKEAKKKEKEDRKAAKAAVKGQPYSGSGHSSASGSTLSLPGLSAIGRRRGNSAASNLRVEATTANAVTSGSSSSSSTAAPIADAATKGKGVDRGPIQTPAEIEIGKSNVDALHPTAVSTPTPIPAPTSAPRPIPSPHQHVGPSHLRQMSSASSASSTPPESQTGSYQNPSLQDPHASGLSLGGQSDNSDEDEAGRSSDHDRDPSASTEPMFNFSSLAEMVGVEMEGVNAGRRLSQIGESRSEEASESGDAIVSKSDVDKRNSMYEASQEHVEDVSRPDEMSKSVVTLTQDSFNVQTESSHHEHEEYQTSSAHRSPPEVMITPETPRPEDDTEDSKQLGFQGTQTVEVHGSAH